MTASLEHIDEIARAPWFALTGPHRHLAESHGTAMRYRTSVGPMVAVPPEPDAGYWADLAGLVGAGPTFLFGGVVDLPESWIEQDRFPVLQMAGPDSFGHPHTDVTRLGPDDVPEMLDLVEQARPGPFERESILYGAYYGVRDEGRLVAMAGERLTTEHWTEISAVCTAPTHRGRGLATHLMEVVAHGIRAAGRRPFLHTGRENPAAELYERLGFTHTPHAIAVQVVSPQP